MKKILFPLVALVCTMSMNAQVMKIMKGTEVVATYTADQADNVVFEEAPAVTTTGTAKRTGNIDVNWVQLWENGPKFAEYNVGAANNKAEDYGGYYAWGGNQDKVDDHNTTNTGKGDLTGADDTATKLWGSNWRMPKQDELQKLIANCDVVWTTINGVSGRKFTGKGDYSSNSVFLPAAGYCYYGNVGGQGYVGIYWSSTPYGSYYAYYLYFDSGYQFVDNFYYRYYGFSVRAVLAE